MYRLFYEADIAELQEGDFVSLNTLSYIVVKIDFVREAGGILLYAVRAENYEDVCDRYDIKDLYDECDIFEVAADDRIMRCIS